MKFYIVATDCDTGRPVYHECKSSDPEEMEWFRASASMPLVSKPVVIRGQTLLDGGISNAIPLCFMEHIGYERNVVILTQDRSYQKKPQAGMQAFRRLQKQYPLCYEAMKNRHFMYNDQLADGHSSAYTRSGAARRRSDWRRFAPFSADFFERIPMNFYFAPMEGVTGYCFRTAYQAAFPGLDRFYTPFLSANDTFQFTHREERDVAPEHNLGMRVVPQIITNNAEMFVWAIQEMAKRGYTEVNLNAGCPSGTVVAKGKGAGLLRDPDRLDEFLDQTFELLEKEGICYDVADAPEVPLFVKMSPAETLDSKYAEASEASRDEMNEAAETLASEEGDGRRTDPCLQPLPAEGPHRSPARAEADLPRRGASRRLPAVRRGVEAAPRV